MSLKRASILMICTVLMTVPNWASAGDVENPAEGIMAEGIRRHVMVLGSDALEGRGPGTRGGRRAAAYIASQLAEYGLDPAGDDGGYFQQVPLHGSLPRPTCRLIVGSLGDETPLVLGRDYLLVTTGEQTLVPRSTPLVFVGYGIVAPEFDYNDYADVDVRGKAVVFLEGEPESSDPGFFLGEQPSVYSAMDTKQRIALSRGAVASVLLLGDRPSAARWQRLQREYGFEHVTAASTVPKHLSLILNPSRAPSLFADALYDHAAVQAMAAGHALRSFHLPVQLSFEGSFDGRSFLSPNVVGALRGSDPELRDTFVVVSAHYDHLGIGPKVDGDDIYNGVVDNALGVGGTLEIARVLSRSPQPLRRSVLFVFTTGEEAGNLGSTYFLGHSSVPPTKMVANINLDGLAFMAAFEDVVGIGGELSSLGEDLVRAAGQGGVSVTPADGYAWSHEAFQRSDQAAFAEAGVPSILVNEGFRWAGTSVAEATHRVWWWFENRYHTPLDDLDQPLDFEAARDHCRVVGALVRRVASSQTPPEWYQGTPYAYERLLSLAGGGR